MLNSSSVVIHFPLLYSRSLDMTMSCRILLLYLIVSQPQRSQQEAIRRDTCHRGDKIAASMFERSIVQIDADVNIDDWETSTMPNRRSSPSRNWYDVIKDSEGDVLAHIRKKAFWQPSAGRPIPVDARLSSATSAGRGVTVWPEMSGSQVDPADISGVKAMRYGKRLGRKQ